MVWVKLNGLSFCLKFFDLVFGAKVEKGKITPLVFCKELDEAGDTV